MNIVARVTTIGWRRITAIKKPLKAPTIAPSASAPTDSSTCVIGSGVMLVASATLTSEITAPTERSKPPTRMTTVSPIAASTKVALPEESTCKSK